MASGGFGYPLSFGTVGTVTFVSLFDAAQFPIELKRAMIDSLESYVDASTDLCLYTPLRVQVWQLSEVAMFIPPLEIESSYTSLNTLIHTPVRGPNRIFEGLILYTHYTPGMPIRSTRTLSAIALADC